MLNNKKTVKTKTAKTKDATVRGIYDDGTHGSGSVYEDGKLKFVGTNSYGDRTVSTLPPSGGKNGDIWYQV